jgi:hypothetical protein
MAAIAGAAAIAVVATASAARGATHAASSYSADVVAAVRAEADWTLGAQMSDGAIAHYTDRVAVWPYVANFAAAGLVRATTVTRDTRYVTAAWKWFGWYQSHETAEGFVTDYTISADGVETSTGDMDSTDAYAGTFLHAVWQAYSATGNRSAVKSLLPGIRGAVRAIEATLDTDGLTWAKPSYHVKYLMDECEVYAGLRAAAKLLSAVGDSAGSAKASTEAGRVQAGVDALWNPVLQSYDWAVHGNGVHQVTSWSNLYPDALEQMWVVGFGLAGSARATQLTATFAQTHPSWDKPAATDYTSGTLQPVEYWPVAGWAMDVAGRTEWAATAAANIRSAALSAARAWPYTPASAGQLTVLLSGGPALA